MNIKYAILTGIAIVSLLSVSCGDYLSTVPDNRTELDSKEKITKLLTSAYASHLYVFASEMMSDNVDDRGSNGFSSAGRLQEEYYAWEDVSEVGNESPQRIWETYYGAIAACNEALKAIGELGNPAELDPQRGEALISRAYHHFMLVNLFCLHYGKNSTKDLGLPYMEAPETTVSPEYDRGTVAEVYEKIEKDIIEGLPLIDDNAYTVPKYHFNTKAASAFAARFYLYYQKWDKAIEYADRVLGANPTTMLRDVKAIAGLTQEYGPIAENYILPDHNANLLLITAYSRMGVIFGNYSTGKKYMHSEYLASTETATSDGPWGSYTPGMFYMPALPYNLGYIACPRLPYLFEFTDPVAQTGYYRTVLPAFEADELLLCRAEAYIMKEDYGNATADLALWMAQHSSSGVTLTRDLVNSYYSGLDYYQIDKPTVKKELHPDFPIVSEEQENFLHCLLHMRRIETISMGLRWFDVKRFGIVIYRRYLDSNNKITQQDELKTDDPRRALQLPSDVVSAGMTPNPR